MGFYSFGVPKAERWVAWAVGGSTLLVGYVVYDTVRSRRGAVELFDSARVERSEEHARYPCVALHGLDVVVRNYYIAEDAATRRRREQHPDAVVFLSDEERAEMAREQLNRRGPSWGRVRQFLALFSNEANHPGKSALVDGRRVLSEQDDLTSVRMVEGHGSGSVKTTAAVSPRDLVFVEGAGKAARTAATDETATGGPVPAVAAGDGDAEAVRPEAAAARPFVASSTWPPHTEKYVALVLEPSRAAPANGADGTAKDGSEGGSHSPEAAALVAEHLRDPLRWLADAATHQSLVRCRGRSALVELNCDADPTYLGAPYLRLMLSAFLLLPSMAGATVNSSQPLRTAVLGVAGGSLPNFLQQYFSSVIKVMDLVDVEPQCFRAAVEQLGMGKLLNATVDGEAPTTPQGAGPLVRVHTCDATAFLLENQRQMAEGLGLEGGATALSSPVTKGTTPVFTSPPPLPPAAAGAGVRAGVPQRNLARPYDVLFVDLFVGSELAGGVNQAEFAQLCRHSLSSSGVVAFNLPERSPPFVETCQRVFGKLNVYTIPTPGSSNVIVLARGGAAAAGHTVESVGAAAPGARLFAPALPHLSHRVLYRRAQQLQHTYKLPYDLANHFPVWWRYW